jgi:hypothetical protein
MEVLRLANSALAINFLFFRTIPIPTSIKNGKIIPKAPLVNTARKLKIEEKNK